MNRNMKKISVAALAGAACLAGVTASNAAVIVTGTKVASSVAFTNGTYDVIVFDVTGLTGTDATTGANAGHTQDAEILALSGAFTATGSGTPGLAALGTSASKQQTNFLSAAGATYGAAGTKHSSYVNFPSSANQTVITPAGSQTPTSFSDAWSTTPGTGTGNVGGVEPGKDPNNVTTANSSADPYANNGMLAEVLVTPGSGVSFTGQYIDYGFPTGNNITFAYSPTTTTTGGSNKIIALAPAQLNGTAPNGYGTAPIGTLTSVNAGQSNTIVPSGAANVSGYVNLVGTANGYVLLQLALNGTVLAPSNSNVTTIIGDINTSAGAGSAVPLTGALAQYASEGFDVAIPLGSQSTFAYDFSSTDGTDPGLAGVSVTAIAAVPEPASAAGVILGAAGLLLGRRKSKLLAV